jgi:putative redox protein
METTISTAGSGTETKAPDVIVRGKAGTFAQEVESGRHRLRGDEPVSYGGHDEGPGPYDYLLIALGTCTSMTIGLYARRKQIPLENITVALRHARIHAKDCEECETKNGMVDRLEVEIGLTGPLTSEQHADLMRIAGRCPVHRTLKSEINIHLKSSAS